MYFMVSTLEIGQGFGDVEEYKIIQKILKLVISVLSELDKMLPPPPQKKKKCYTIIILAYTLFERPLPILTLFFF